MIRHFAFGAAAALALLLTVRTASPQTAAADLSLPPSGYVWLPEVAPRGPVSVVVDLRAQRIHVYRNGVRIGLARVSTGRPGFETPPGAYAILEKEVAHVSNLYQGAQMPYMQRLTWSGIALHAGAVPDRPASHGCIRLPLPFAERLYGVTRRGMTVIVSDAGPSPGWVQVESLWRTGSGHGAAAGALGTKRTDAAPITLVWGAQEQELLVLREGIEIDRGTMAFEGAAWHGTRAYLLLAGTSVVPSVAAPGRQARRWLEIPLADVPGDATLRDRTQIVIDPSFAARIYDLLTPGSTLLMTDQPIRSRTDAARPLLEAEALLDRPQ